MRRVFLFAALFVVTTSQGLGQVSKAQLLDMIAKSVPKDVILSLVKKDCVEFEMNAEAVIELSGKVPKEVLQAAIDCQTQRKTTTGGSRVSQAPRPEELECRIYQELQSNPVLSDFPVVYRDAKNGYVSVVIVQHMIWSRERAGAGQTYAAMFDLIGRHKEMQNIVKSTLMNIPSVKDVAFYEAQLSTEALAQSQKDYMMNACSAKGKLSIDSNPEGATVLIDGRNHGVTPQTISVITGTHTVRLEKQMYRRQEINVDIKEGKAESISITLEPLPKVSISSDPDGCSVFMDQQEVGVTPVEVHVEPGEHVLKIQKATYVPYEGKLLIGQTDASPVFVTLQRLAKLSVSSKPDGAVVTINQEKKGVSPLELYLEPGRYSAEIVMPRYRKYATIMDLDYGDQRQLQAVLSPVPRDEYCHVLDLHGTVGKNFKALKSKIIGMEFSLAIPLYQVVTSALNRKIDSTHVFDGKEIGYEPRYGTTYVQNPDDLRQKQLGGFSIGEYVADVVFTPPGKVKVSDVDKKKSTIRVSVTYQDGQKNSVFFDFSRDLSDVTLDDFYDALCFCFPKFTDSETAP